MKNRIIFYSSVKNKELFNIQRFYHIDIELLKNLGYSVNTSNNIFDFLYFWKYDIAFIYFYKFGLFPAMLSRIFLKRVYFTGGIDNLEESATFKKDYTVQKLFFKLCYIFSHKCILVSSSDQNNVKKIYNGILPKKICLSFHTIDVEKFIYTGLYEKQKYFSTIAWMESVDNVLRKGLDKALIIFELLTKKEEYSDAKLLIIGKEGEGSDYLKKHCISLNLSNKVIFTGSIDEERKIDILKHGKYYFQLSSYEGFGIAALEALAAKNIVIHSGNGGLKDSVKDFGIKVDLKLSAQDQAVHICKQLENFEYKKLDVAQKYIQDNYSNMRRQKDFEKLLKY